MNNRIGGFRVFIYKVKALTDKAHLLISGILAIPCVLLMRSLKKIVLFRIGTIRTDRIGHFAIPIPIPIPIPISIL